jgi:hypothetical protein
MKFASWNMEHEYHKIIWLILSNSNLYMNDLQGHDVCIFGKSFKIIEEQN